MIIVDASARYNVIPTLQPISYYVKAGEGSYAPPITVSGAFWQKITQDDWQKNPGLLQQTSRSVDLWTYEIVLASSGAMGISGTYASGVGFPVPKLDDVIYDKINQEWVVRAVEIKDLDVNGVQRWRCICNKSLDTIISGGIGYTGSLVLAQSSPPSPGFQANGGFFGTLGGPV